MLKVEISSWTDFDKSYQNKNIYSQMKSNQKIQFLLVLIVHCAIGNLIGQENIFTKDGERIEVYFDRSEACNKELVFRVVPEIPRYRGGLEQLELELNNAIIVDKKIKETYYVRCTINCRGEIFGLQNSKGETFDESNKIINQILLLQNWEAGKFKGEDVDCFYGFFIKIKRGKISLEK